MFGNFNLPDVTVGTSLTDLCDYDVTDLVSLGIAFELSAKVNDDPAGPWALR